MTLPDHFLMALLNLPVGTFTGTSGNRRYVVSHQIVAGGRAHKLVAHELGGSDYISLNLYLTRPDNALLRPCEMSAEKVTDFVLTLVPDVQE